MGSIRGRILWKLFFLVAIWSIWKERNMICFGGKGVNDSLLVEKVKRLVVSWASPIPQFKGISANFINQHWKEVADSNLHFVCISPRWRPPIGAVKLNFDGSAFGNPGRAVVGGVIRNEEGTILLSYSGPAGFCSINKAELLALSIGLNEAFRLIP